MTSSATPVAFVTGAARGIGLAIARWFFHQGHRVAVIDNDAPTLTTLIAKPNTYLIIPIPCDESGEPETGDHRPRPG